ncbi:Fpg/Nei family DNA glycosylase [Pseudonocardia xishanensis]|uniref:DNA-(apurinic or apyrimidinic site) lyase n=1 Tax=Pseudonocardia xishanensis TaxID=630995 RepID=A0ABP8S181_9PSEU
MPEGHTLHRLARRHRTLFAHRPVGVSSPQGRFAESAALLDGLVLRKAEAHGKHLFHMFDRDLVVHVHLGLYGTFDEGELPVSEPRGRLRLRLVGETHFADLRGPTACELLTRAEVKAIRERLGPDPLRRDFDPERVWARISRSSSPLATLLMDQKVVSGVGNVYRAELLYRHGLDPQTSGRSLDRGTWDAMAADLVTLMRDGVRKGRIDTVRPEDDPRRKGFAARRDRHGGEVYVYRRAGMPCHVCGTEVRTTVHAARNLFWCPTCQK